jgi:EAL domain-containing protein (putative c-di-GMP-specific phosphodiesterase class I)
MIAIDDFGVEYSNLDILEKLDFDIIKLDKYFIDDIEDSEVRKLIMNFLSELTIITGKAIIAEGVEKISQRDAIKKIKNDKFYIQGYIYSKPVSIDDIPDIKINN